MEIKFGLISADSHAGFNRDDFTSRMSASKWGDKIPHIASSETAERDPNTPAAFQRHEAGEGWSVYGRPPGALANCPALMPRHPVVTPRRWEEVPETYYDPSQRLK